MLDQFIHGAKLKSYSFDKYKTKKQNKLIELDIVNKKNLYESGKDKRFNSLVEGVNFTKDLVSEPGNILHPTSMQKD